MIRRGHRLQELKREYTIAQVQLFQRAAALNSQQERLEQAEAVALGIAEAFNPKAELLKKYRAALNGPQAVLAGSPTSENPLQPWVAGLPVVKRKRRDGG